MGEEGSTVGRPLWQTGPNRPLKMNLPPEMEECCEEKGYEVGGEVDGWEAYLLKRKMVEEVGVAEEVGEEVSTLDRLCGLGRTGPSKWIFLQRSRAKFLWHVSNVNLL